MQNSAPIGKPKIGGIVLSGGRSTRMGSEKGLVDFGGQPMIAGALRCLASCVDDVLVVANDPAYLAFGHPVMEDEFKGAGPLSGLVSGLRKAKWDLNIVLPCDMPLMDARLLHWMLAGYEDEAAAVCQYEERLQPLVGLYHRRSLPILERLLAAGQLKMRIALEELHAAVLDPQRYMPDFEGDWMRNFNSKAEIDAYLQAR